MTTGTIIEFRPRERAGQVAAREFQPAKPSQNANISARKPAQRSAPGNREVTHARWRAFFDAQRRVDFYEALKDAVRIAEHLVAAGDVPEAATCHALRNGEHGISCPLLAKLRQARAALVLTPASCKAQLAVKLSVIKSDGKYLGLKPERIAAAVAADEAYIAIPKHKRADAIRRKAVQL